MESTTVITAGSAAGSTFSTTITTNNTMTQGQTIRVSTNGASTGSTEALVMLVLERL
jgi:polygalacturonase